MISVKDLEKTAKAELKQIASAEDLEAFRVSYLGKKGKVAPLMEHLKTLDIEGKKTFGRDVNLLKQFLKQAIDEKKESLGKDSGDSFFDPTLPGIQPNAGRIHPISQIIQEVCSVFEKLGFEIADGPEIETEFHNFTALNIPLDHASRDDVDTFYTPSGHILRSQTSTVQIRVMENKKPPLRIIAPGRVYRPDTVDASHSFMFHQIEGLLVDEKVPFSDLKGLLHLVLRELFGEKIELRFRPHFFPFTEPSVEVDLKWGKKWLEILGAGTVDPNVFKAVGYDPKKVQGLAFGLGVERIAMLRYGIPDIRYFYENDLRFLEQF